MAKAKTRQKEKVYLLPIVVEPMEEGGYFAECPLLQGCHAEGETLAEAIENLQDVMRIIIESYKELGKEIPAPLASKNFVLAMNIPVHIK